MDKQCQIYYEPVMRKALLKPSEHQIQNAIMHLLRYKGHYCIRLNSGMLPMQFRGKQRLVRLAEKGTPDLISISEGHAYFWEVKRPKNNITWLQEQKMEELEKYGARCFVVHSTEEVEKLLKEDIC